MTGGLQLAQIYSLTPVQEGILAQCMWSRTQSNYFMQKLYSVDGGLDLDILQRSIDEVVRRHEMLRTIFIYRKILRPRQVVLKHRSAAITYMDFSELGSSDAVTAAIERYKQEDKNKGFDLSRDLLFRFAIIKTAHEKYKFIFSFHHIVMDGWSLNIVFKQLFEIYSELLSGASLDMGEPVSLSGYIDWLGRQNDKDSINYWKKYLNMVNYEPLIPERTELDIYGRHDEYEFQLDQVDTRRLASFAVQHGITVSNVLQAIWALFLYRQTGKSDVVFGRLVSGRKPSVGNIENTVGLFINIVPLRTNITSSDSVLSLTRQIQNDVLESEAHDYLPLQRIVAEMKVPRLFDHLIVFENFPMDYKELAASGTPDLNLSVRLDESEEKVVFPLYIYIVPNEQMSFRIKYFPHAGSEAFMQAVRSFFTDAVRQLEFNNE